MIVWSDEAKKTYEAVIDDLLKKWPVNVAIDLKKKQMIYSINFLITNNFARLPNTKNSVNVLFTETLP